MKKLMLFGDQTPKCGTCGSSLPEDQILRFRLWHSGPDLILSVVDGYGRIVSRGNLLVISKELGTKTTITRIACVSPDLGFDLDPDGRIVGG